MGFSKKLLDVMSNQLQERGFSERQTEIIIEVMNNSLETCSRIKPESHINEKKYSRRGELKLYRVNYFILGSRGKEYKREEVNAINKENAILEISDRYPECKVTSAWKINI